jgi:hypothetical protein
MDGSGTADRVDRAAVSPGVSETGASHTREIDPRTVTQRLQREGRWFGQIELERDDMMRLAKDKFATKEERQLWVYGELDRMYPPPENAPMAHSEGESDRPGNAPMAHSEGDPGRPNAHSDAHLAHSDGQIQGLGDIPDDWPELPSNASLSAEVGWVQANRLRIVEERPGRATLVRLGRALSPAPSWAALGWLETSIRPYAKFVDVAAKAASVDDGESAVVRRERMAIAEVEALLNEMMEGQTVCRCCGQAIAPK